jgi:tRNA threonylcarbamoyladenosine biosynthesis protein TsaB
MAGRVVNLLAIESATDMVGVGLLSDGGGAVERVHLGGRAHAELLVPAIEEVCALAGCTVNEVDAIAVDIGPGLFTGLRVGVATAKALAQALGVDLIGVGSLDILAAAVAEQPGRGRPGVVASVVDARRGEVFAALYRFDQADGPDAGPAPDTGPIDPGTVRTDRLEPIAPDELEAWLVEVGSEAGAVTVVGDGAVRYRAQLSVHAALDLDPAGELGSPPPLALARLARRRLERGDPPVAPVELVPDYRRPADARINWEQRAPRSAGPVGGGGTAP